MSAPEARIPVDVLAHPTLQRRPGLLRTLLWVARHADWTDGGTTRRRERVAGWCFVDRDALARDLGVHRSTADEHVRALADAAQEGGPLLVQWSAPDRSAGRSTEYLVAYMATAHGLAAAQRRAADRAARREQRRTRSGPPTRDSRGRFSSSDRRPNTARTVPPNTARTVSNLCDPYLCDQYLPRDNVSSAHTPSPTSAAPPERVATTVTGARPAAARRECWTGGMFSSDVIRVKCARRGVPIGDRARRGVGWGTEWLVREVGPGRAWAYVDAAIDELAANGGRGESLQATMRRLLDDDLCDSYGFGGACRDGSCFESAMRWRLFGDAVAWAGDPADDPWRTWAWIDELTGTAVAAGAAP